MLDFGFSELLLVMAVAVLVLGPEEIPKIMVALGRITRRLAYIKYAFSQQFEDFMREADLDDIRRRVNFEEDKKSGPGIGPGVGEIEFDEAAHDAPDDAPDDVVEPDAEREDDVGGGRRKDQDQGKNKSKSRSESKGESKSKSRPPHDASPRPAGKRRKA